MKLRNSLFAWLMGLAFLAQGVTAEERILAFDSVIAVSRDGTLQVTETIRVRAEGVNLGPEQKKQAIAAALASIRDSGRRAA